MRAMKSSRSALVNMRRGFSVPPPVRMNLISPRFTWSRKVRSHMRSILAASVMV